MPLLLQVPLEPEIGHHRADDAGPRQPIVLFPAFRDHRQQLIAVDDAPALVHHDDAVGIAVERDADVGAHFHAPCGGAPSGAVEPQSLLILKPSGSTPTREDLGAKLPQRAGRNAIGRAVGAIHHHAQAIKAHVLRQGALGKFDVSIMHAVDALGAAEIGALGQALGDIAVDQLLDLKLQARR